MNFSYDLYTKTCDEYHKKHVEEMFLKMYKNKYIYPKKNLQPYCKHCGKFEADRELELICPNCGLVTKGDQCDCGYVPNEDDLIGATCRECGNKTIQKDNILTKTPPLTAKKTPLIKKTDIQSNIKKQNLLVPALLYSTGGRLEAAPGMGWGEWRR